MVCISVADLSPESDQCLGQQLLAVLHYALANVALQDHFVPILRAFVTPLATKSAPAPASLCFHQHVHAA